MAAGCLVWVGAAARRLAIRYRGEETLRFERICQPWLKEAAKRWARGRLLADTAPRTMSAYLVSVRHFSQWLAEHAREVSAPALAVAPVA